MLECSKWYLYHIIPLVYSSHQGCHSLARDHLYYNANSQNAISRITETGTRHVCRLLIALLYIVWIIFHTRRVFRELNTREMNITLFDYNFALKEMILLWVRCIFRQLRQCRGQETLSNGQSIIGMIACEQMHSGITLYTDVPCTCIHTASMHAIQPHTPPHTLCGSARAVKNRQGFFISTIFNPSVLTYSFKLRVIDTDYLCGELPKLTYLKKITLFCARFLVDPALQFSNI